MFTVQSTANLVFDICVVKQIFSLHVSGLTSYTNVDSVKFMLHIYNNCGVYGIVLAGSCN